MTTTRYPIRIDPSSRWLVRLAFGASDETAWVDLGHDEMTARFGWWELTLPTEDIIGWRIEGPWHWITAIGVRRSIRGGDLSFAGSPRGGVRLELARPLHWKRLSVPVFYVGVDDLDGFAAALAARGIPGADTRAGGDGGTISDD